MQLVRYVNLQKPDPTAVDGNVLHVHFADGGAVLVDRGFFAAAAHLRNASRVSSSIGKKLSMRNS